MNKNMNTEINYEFQDGTTCKMTLTFYKLYQLRAKNQGLYKRYVAIINKGKAIEELDMITIMYVSYICANMDADTIMTEEEFMIKCGSDRISIMDAYKKLTQPKKPTASEERF